MGESRGRWHCGKLWEWRALDVRAEEGTGMWVWVCPECGQDVKTKAKMDAEKGGGGGVDRFRWADRSPWRESRDE